MSKSQNLLHNFIPDFIEEWLKYGNPEPQLSRDYNFPDYNLSVCVSQSELSAGSSSW